MNAALLLTLIVGAGEPVPRWEAGSLTPHSEATAEVLVQGPGSVDVMLACDCMSQEIVAGTGVEGEPTRVRLHLRPGARLGWHRTDVQVVQHAPDKTRIHRIPVTFEVPSLLPALEPELIFQYGRDHAESRRALGELAPLLTRLGWTHVVYPTHGAEPLSVTDAAGTRTAGVAAVRSRLHARCAEGEQAPRGGANELLFFHDPVGCSSADTVKTQVVDAAVARHGLVLRDLPLDRPENLRLFCALSEEAGRPAPGLYAAWAAGRLFVAEPEIREILPRHLARAFGQRLLASTNPTGTVR